MPANTENELLQPNLGLLWLMYYCVTEITNVVLYNAMYLILDFWDCIFK